MDKKATKVGNIVSKEQLRLPKRLTTAGLTHVTTKKALNSEKSLHKETNALSASKRNVKTLEEDLKRSKKKRDNDAATFQEK